MRSSTHQQMPLTVTKQSQSGTCDSARHGKLVSTPGTALHTPINATIPPSSNPMPEINGLTNLINTYEVCQGLFCMTDKY